MRRPAILLSSLVVALAPGVAHADRWSSSDPAGDVDTTTQRDAPYVSDQCTSSTADGTDAPRPGADVTRLAVRHEGRAVEVTVGLGRVADTFDLEVAMLVPDGEYAASVSVVPGDTSVRLVPHFTDQEAHQSPGDCFVLGAGHESTTRCRGLATEVSTRRHRVVVTVPRSCLDRPRWVRAGASVALQRQGDDDHTPCYVDHWTPAKHPHAAYPVYGTKVRPPTTHHHR